MIAKLKWSFKNIWEDVIRLSERCVTGYTSQRNGETENMSYYKGN